MIGTSFGRYEILEELGHGGMSIVYRGRDADLEREVAIKLLHSHLAKKDDNRERLHREAKAIARLRHPNILEIYDYSGQDADRAYIVMEYVEGANLRQFLDAHGPPPPEYCALIGLDLCRALGHAHDHGIIHRDLKPENVMVSARGQLKLMDFGIAHVFDAETMTQTGSLLGSPAHMAPEMIEGERVDERADIFALGTVLYWLCTGELPFEGRNAPQVLKRVLEGLYKTPEALDARIGQCFASIIHRCMAHRPEERYESVDEAASALEVFASRAAIAPADLSLYLTEPEAAREAFCETIVDRLMDEARRAVARDERARAYKIFNRILGYDPHNAFVRAQLARVERRRRRVIIASAAFVGVIAAAIGLWTSHYVEQQRVERAEQARALSIQVDRRFQAERAAATLGAHSARSIQFTSRHVARRASGALNTSIQGAGVASHIEDNALRAAIALSMRPVPRARPASVSARTTGPSVEDTKPSIASDMGAPQTPPVPKTQPYRFRLLPTAAQMTISDKEGIVRTYDALHLASSSVVLEEKKEYRVEIRSPGCQTKSFRFFIDGPQQQPYRTFALNWLDSMITISSNKQSVVQINGGYVDEIRESGGRLEHRVSFGKAQGRPPTKTLRITVHDSTRMTNKFSQTITVRPDERYTISAPL